MKMNKPNLTSVFLSFSFFSVHSMPVYVFWLFKIICQAIGEYEMNYTSLISMHH